MIKNAKEAMEENDILNKPKELIIETSITDDGHGRIIIRDNGQGILHENIDRIFNHGYTTKKSGHGFGLHSSALAMKEMGGSLTAYSAGLNQGAEFILIVKLADHAHPPATIPAVSTPC